MTKAQGPMNKDEAKEVAASLQTAASEKYPDKFLVSALGNKIRILRVPPSSV